MPGVGVRYLQRCESHLVCMSCVFIYVRVCICERAREKCCTAMDMLTYLSIGSRQAGGLPGYCLIHVGGTLKSRRSAHSIPARVKIN